jgi:8-amino-7-oxononanoate synthase
LLGVEDTLLLPTLTHIHAAVVPVLADQGTIFVDARAHKTIWDGCVVARAHGATVVRFAHHDPQALGELLRRHTRPPRLVCLDGVNSMTGNPPDLPAFTAVARAHDALLYLDDAHGFGVVGEPAVASRSQRRHSSVQPLALDGELARGSHRPPEETSG